MEYALELRSIGKRYGRHRALDGVSLRVRRGDLYGFLGHNGAGKTTALRIALGLIPPDSGIVLVDGFDARRHPREARARQGGLIETPGFYPWLSGRRNLRMLARLRGLDARASRLEADRLLDEIGLSSAGDRRVGGYSQGMRQRLGIAQALLARPSLVLLDEPTNGLDPEGIELVRRLLVRITREEGGTVLVSSHQLAELATVCDRIGILRQGRMVVEARTAELLGEEARLLLRTDDDVRSRSVLEEAGVASESHPDGGLLLPALDTKERSRIARELLSRGVALEELSPRRVTLEEIYLRATREENSPAPPVSEAEPAVPSPPAVSRAPRRPLLRSLGHEVRRLSSHPAPILFLLLPGIVAALSVLRRWGTEKGHLEAVESGELFSQTLVTAWESTAGALSDSILIAAVVLAGLASQSLAGELARGTLRNLLICPLGRIRLSLGKGLGMLSLALVVYLLVATASVGTSTFAFDFTDVVEILEIKSAEPWVIVPAAEIEGPFLRMLLLLPLVLGAYTGIGFLAGALTRGSVSALALATGAVVFLDLLRVPGREFGFEAWLPSAHLPSPLGDTSVTADVLERIRFPNDIFTGHVDSAVLVPVLWIAVTFSLSALILGKRSVP